MAKYSNTIEYNINTKLDSSGLVKLQAQIKQLENSMQQMSNRELLNSDKVQKAKAQLEGLNTALTNSFNSSLGILDLSKFRAELDSSGVSAVGLRSAFNMMGAEGQTALNGLTTQIANFNGGMERTSSAVDKIATTFGNTFRWGVIASFFSQFMNAIHSSIDYVKELDDSLTQIMLVTDYNRDSMNAYAKAANEAAKAVGQTTVGMTNASLIFAQQGYDLSQSQELATLSAKLANASQQDTATTSDQITAYMNAYGLSSSIEDLSSALDSWALVANVSAADVAELATASQKAASTANSVGVNMDQLNAQIATIESVTRDAPEQIGNGLKTLYARFSDIKLGKTLEDGVNLGQVTGQLNKLGVQVLDQFGNIRDVGDILEDLMVIWDDLDQTTKEASAQTLAGKFQMNRFLALMDNSDMYREYLGASENAEGTLDQMNEEYLDSLEGRTARIQASLEGIFSSIFDTDVVYPFIDAMQKFLDIIQTLIDSLGGGSTIVLGLVSAFGQLFSQNIARGINDTLANRELMQIRQRNIEGVNDTLDRVGIDRNSGIGQYISNTAAQAKQGAINDVQYDTYMNNVQNWINAQTALTQSEEELQDTINALNMAYGKAVGENNAVFKDEHGLNTQFANDERLNLNQSQINKIMSQTDFSDAIAGARNFSNELQQVQSIQEKFNSTSANSNQQLEQLYLASDRADAALEQLYNTGVISDDMFNDMKTAIAKVVVDLEDSGQATDQTEQELNNLILTMGRFVKTAEGMDANQLKKMLLGGAEEVQKKQTTRDFNQTQVDRAQANANDSEANIDNQQQIKQIVDTVSALGQLAFAIQSVQSLGSIWKNEDLTTGEKVLQTITNLSMVIPSVVTAWKTLSTAVIGQTIATKAEAIQTGILTGIKAAELKTTQELAKAEAELAFIRQFGQTSAGGRTAEELEELIGQLSKGTPVLDKLKGAFSGLSEAIGVTGAAATAAVGIVAVLGGIIAYGVWQLEEAKKKAWEAYETANEIVDKFKELQTSVEDFNNNFSIFKETGENGDKLIEQAEELATALREVGAEEEAQAIHLATVRAESLGTAEAFENLANTVNDNTALTSAYEDVIRSSADVLTAQNMSLNGIITQQRKIKDLQAELNNLNPWDFDNLEAFESAQKSLQTQIRELEDYIEVNQEAADAVDSLINAQGTLAGIYAADLNGGDTKASGWENQAGPPDAYRTVDTETLRQFFSQNVQGFDELYNDLEQIDFMLQYVTDDAQKADLQMQQLLHSNENLTDQRSVDYGAGDIGTSSDYLEIAGEMQRAGFSAQQQLQLIATLDENASREEILNAIHRVQEYMDNGDSFSLALQAGLELNPQEIENMVKSQLAEYQPTDEDVKLEDFQTLTNTLLETDQLGQEGSPFEDYSEELQNNANALENLAEGILRYNDAIETIDKNMQSWEEALSNSNEFSSEHIKAIQELQETYSDFLDLSEDLGVSEEFAANAENLELMKNAANGVEGAYEDLAKAAAEDILIHADVSDIDRAQSALEGLFDFVDSDLANLDIGESFDLDPIREQIDDLATATGWTADQMVAYLNGIGIQIDPSMFETAEDAMGGMVDASAAARDAIAENSTWGTEVEAESATESNTDTMQYYSAIPHISYESWNATLPMNGVAGPASGGGGPSSGTIPRVTYTLEPATAEKVTDTTITKTGSKFVPGGTGGIRLKKGAIKGTKGAGAGKRATASRPSGGSGGRGGGKGGGGKGKKGSGGKAKTIEPKEKKEHEKDYYEEVNSQLDKTEKILSRIEKEEDRLIGDKARANQNKQLTLLQKEIKLNEEKLEINKQELKDTDERLKQQDKLAEQILKQQGLSMLIPEPVLDEDGVIANFEQISKALDDAHNQLIDKYNAAAKAGNEELTKEIEKQIGKFDDYSKNLLDAAKRHDTLQSEIEETTNALEDLKDAIEDIQIAAYNAALDAAEEWQELIDKGAELQGFFREFDPDSYLRSFSIDERPYERIIEDLYTLQNEYAVAGDQANQFYNDIIAQKRKELEETNDLYEQQAILDAIQYFEDEQSRITEDFLENGVVGYWSRRLEELQQWMDNPNDASNPFGENTAELVETYKRVWEQAAEETENFREKVQDLRDDIIDAVEEFDDDLDRQYDKFEDLIDELEQIGDTYTLYYGDDSYTELADILQKEGEVLQSELDRRQQEYEKWVELYQQALETGDKKTIQAIEDLMNDARKEMRDSAEQLAEVWVKQFETSINRSTQQMTQNVWGRNDLEELSDNWELEKQYIEDYKDEVEKAYEIDKLRSKYIDLLNDAQGASLATQNKIRQEMQDQLNYLENQATVSEYDVKLANAKLEILQKQIALEDAQRNKNRMQLRRDTQGNYRYVYRADDDDIKQAQDELLESSYDIYEITKDQTITNNDRMISSFLDFQEKARNIAEKYKDDEVARQAALNDLAEQYKKIWTALGEDFGDVTNGMYDVLWWNINNLIGNSADASLEKMNQLYDENGNIKEKTGEQWRDLATEIQNDVIDKVYDSAIDCITDINVSGQRLASNIAGSLDVIGAGVDSLDISLAEATDATRNLKEATDDLFAAFNGDNAQINNAMKMISDYRAELEKTQNSASNLAKQLTEANKKIANLTAENTAYKTSINNSPSKRTGSSSSSSGGGSSSSGGSGGSSSSGGSRSSGGSSSSGSSGGSSSKSSFNFKKQVKQNTTSKIKNSGILNKLMRLDTGGYTGEWGSDGRLAVLHQKELVLNAEDTENILGAVAMMRGMVSAIQTGALSRSISSSINNANKNFGDTIEQRVEISATFPAVTNSNEIEAALLGLSDKAYQYSYRTR